jgi:hypothetical protein
MKIEPGKEIDPEWIEFILSIKIPPYSDKSSLLIALLASMVIKK